ncbi:malectin domain-containing carbohydrate-binding protein, partial [Reyranella sp.]|uniref:malectin domain-containing carbohydrate-binding protein n=1 Tax=Reyranella sp. TaxID=1929291 RepID=UPI003D12982B
TQPTAGQWAAVEVETIDVIKNIPNHNDDGSLNAALADRQVTGLLVTGTTSNPVLYVTSSDPRIANFSDADLDTNSGILSKLTWNGAAWEKVDLIRGLPRSEENHSPNGMVLSADGTKLYLAQGGNTNNGAPSHFFSNTPEYALTGAVLEIDLAALAAMPDKIFTYAPGVTSVYKYDLPTLDDPTVANNGASGNETSAGLDVGGPFGGNDGLNQAVLPADAPLRIYATGLRNAYDLVLTEAGKFFTIDNGPNSDLGGVPVTDANGEATNLFNNGGTGSGDFLYLLSDGGYFGHPDPTRSNQTGSIYAYSDGLQPQVIASIPNAADAVPDGLAIAPGFVIDPSKFTSSATRLDQEGKYSGGQMALAQFGASTNGLMEYTASTFDGEIMGDLITASFDGTLKLIKLSSDGTTVLDVTTLATPGGTPLDVVQGPDGSIWVAQIGSGQVTVLTPSSTGVVADPDIDDDGVPNTIDPFQADAANGFGTWLTKNATLDWNLQFGAADSAPGPSGLFLGLTGHMTNGSRDFVAPVEAGGLDLTNVKIGTAAGGGLLVVENVSTGTASGVFNTGEFVFQTGVAFTQDVSSFDIQWTAVNPFPGLAASPTTRQIGGFIGTGDQANFLKVVAGPTGSGNVQFELESNNVVVATQTLNAAGLLNAPVDSSLVFNLAVNRATAQATPSVTYAGSSGPITVTGSAISLAGTSILSAIDGSYMVQGKASGLAVGLWSSNTGEGSQDTFQATFDDISITSTAAAGQPVKAVNVGGGQVTASNGVVFQADPGPTTGAAASQTFATTAAISGTIDDALYQDERWTPGGSYTYEVPVANGTYRVDLLLAEIYSGITGPGQRVFDMALEGQTLPDLQNIDVFSKVGANAAFTISQQVTVSDGSLSIQVGPGSSAAGNVENAKLNAFAIYPVGAQPSATLSIAAALASQNEGNSGSTAFSFTVTRTGDTSGSSTASYALTGSGSAPANAADFTGGVLPTGTVSFAAGETGKTITVNVAGDGTAEPTETFVVTLSSPSAGTTIGTASATGSILNDDSGGTNQLIKAVNVGGGQVTASGGMVFQADPGPTTGAAASQTFATTSAISGTTDDALYQDERWTPGGSYTYEVPVANGTYRVDLLLAEIYSGITGAGQRVFDMALEGQALPALQNIDIFAQVGANAAFTISQQVTVSDGSLSIQVGPGSSAAGNVENAKLNAFAIFAVSAPPSATLSIAAANASQNEGNSGSTAFTFTVTRSGDTSGSSTASYAVAGSGSAPANAADFAGGVLPTGTVSFAAGETSKTITVNVAGDATVEQTETFSVTLSSPGAGTTIGTASATGSILNDDGTTNQLIKAVNVGGGQVTASTGV